MKVKLKKIKPTSKPIRELESEDIEALTQSIKEFGLLQPFRVRRVDDRYEVIFGNARLEAAKRAGLKEVEVVVADVNDDQALIEAGVENLLRTDMSEPEKGRWSLKVREQMGWSQRDLAKRLGIAQTVLARWELQAKRLAPDIAELVRPAKSGELVQRGLSGHQAREIAKLDSHGEQRKLAEKAMREDLPGPTLGEIRRAIKGAPDERTVERILETPWIKTREEVAEEIEEGEIGVLAEEIKARIEKEEERRWWDEHPLTKQFLEMLKRHMRLMRRGYQSVERGKIPAEHCNYLARYIEDKVIALDQEIANELKERAKKWQ